MPQKELRILPTKYSPEIILKTGAIVIRGRSMKIIEPEFYHQIEKWINKYVSEPADVTYVDIYLEYLNTGNLIYYNNLLKKFVSISSKEKKLIINWHHEEGDEDMLEKGEYLSSILDVPFNYVITT